MVKAECWKVDAGEKFLVTLNIQYNSAVEGCPIVNIKDNCGLTLLKLSMLDRYLAFQHDHEQLLSTTKGLSTGYLDHRKHERSHWSKMSGTLQYNQQTSWKRDSWIRGA